MGKPGLQNKDLSQKKKNQRMTTLNKKKKIRTLGNESLKSPKFLRFVWIGTKAFVFSKTMKAKVGAPCPPYTNDVS